MDPVPVLSHIHTLYIHKYVRGGSHTQLWQVSDFGCLVAYIYLSVHARASVKSSLRRSYIWYILVEAKTHKQVSSFYRVKKMDKYEVVKDLGAGNFGVARLLRHKETKELVAMKYIERGLKVCLFSVWLLRKWVFYFIVNIAIDLKLVKKGVWDWVELRIMFWEIPNMWKKFLLGSVLFVSQEKQYM